MYLFSVNKTFETFAKDYGFTVKPCIAATPKTKGKVETQMKFLDEARAYSGKLNLVEFVAFVEKNQYTHQQFNASKYRKDTVNRI